MFRVEGVNRTRLLVALVVVVHVLFVAAPMDVLWPVNAGHIGRLMVHGHLPYRDFTFEYPPLAALVFILPGLVPAALAKSVLALEAVAAEAAVAWLVLRHHPGALRRYAVLSICVFPFLAGGFDGVPMALIAISTALAIDGRAAGWWAAAAGVLVKMSPGGLWVWARRRRGTAVLALAVTVVVALAPLAIARDADSTYIGWSVHRGVEVESVGATVSWVQDLVTNHPVVVVNRFRSNELEGAGPAAAFVTVLALGALAALALAARRTHADPWLTAFAVLLVLMCGFKVLSPQYIAWGAPLAAVLGGRWFRWYASIAALTLGTYVLGHQTLLLTATAIRNCLLVGLTAAAVKAVVRPEHERVLVS